MNYDFAAIALATFLKMLKTRYSDDDICEILKPSNVRGGLEILNSPTLTNPQ